MNMSACASIVQIHIACKQVYAAHVYKKKEGENGVLHLSACQWSSAETR